MDLYIPNESPSDTGKDTCDYEVMTTHAFKQPEPVECDCDAMNQHADQHNCDQEEEAIELDVLNF